MLLTVIKTLNTFYDIYIDTLRQKYFIIRVV